MRKVRKLSLLVILFLLSGTTYWALQNVKNDTPPLPQPMGEMNEDGEDHAGREEYFRFRFAGNEEDYDWKTRYGKVRRDAAEARLVRQKRALRSGSFSRSESFADGLLTGTWAERGAKNQAGRVVVTDVLESKDLVVLGTAGGSVMVGPVSGNEYDILNDQIKFSLKSVHSFENGTGVRIVAVERYGVYYTDDNGATWDKSFSGSPTTTTLSRTDNIIYMVTSNGDIYSSVDKGSSFTKIGSVTNTNGKYELWTSRYESGEVYIMANNSFYKKSGSSFTSIGTVAGVSSPGKVALSGDVTKANSTLFAAFVTGANAQVYTSTNGGTSWSFVSDAGTGMFSENSFFSATESVLYAGGMECYRSTNGGSSWSKINGWTQYYDAFGGDPEKYLHADIPEIRSYKDKAGTPFTLISTDGGTYITYDHSNYKNITLNGMRNNQYYGSNTRWDDPDILLAGAQDQGIQISQPNGVDTIMDFYQYTSGDQGAFTSSDSGKSSWYTYVYGALYYHPTTLTQKAYSAGKPSSSDKFMWMAATVADPADPKVCYTGGQQLHKTVYNGPSSFSHSLHSSFSFGSTITAIAISPVDNNHWYVATSNRAFFHSSDRGKNWTQVSSGLLGNHWLVGQGIEPDPSILGRVYLSGNGNGSAAVFVSDNHGQSFTKLGTSTPTTSVLDMVMTEDGKFLFAAAVDAPYVYVPEKDTWYNMSGNKAPDTYWFTVEYIETSKLVRFATHGRGIWDFQIGETVDPDPFVTVKSPNGGELFAQGDTVTFTWDSYLEGDITIFLLKSGVKLQDIATVAASPKSFKWVVDTTLENGNDYTISIVSGSDAAIKDESDAAFTIKTLLKLDQKHLGVISTDSEESNRPATNVIDGDPATFWHTEWSQSQPGFPHEIIFSCDTSVSLAALEYTGRQDGSNNGHVKGYEVYLSEDGDNWIKVASGELSGSGQTEMIAFDTTLKAEQIKFVALSEAGGNYYASASEVNLCFVGGDTKSSSALLKANSVVAIHMVGKSSISIPLPANSSYSLSVISANGRIVYSKNGVGPVQRLNLGSQGLARGFYIIKVRSDFGLLTKRITIQ